MHDEQSNPEKEACFGLLKDYIESLSLTFPPKSIRKVIVNITKIERGTPCACFSEECEEALLNIEEPK